MNTLLTRSPAGTLWVIDTDVNAAYARELVRQGLTAPQIIERHPQLTPEMIATACAAYPQMRKRVEIYLRPRHARALGVRPGWATATLEWDADAQRWCAVDVRRGPQTLLCNGMGLFAFGLSKRRRGGR